MFANLGRAMTLAIVGLSILFLSISSPVFAQPWQRVQAGTTINLEGVFGADSYSLAVGMNGTMIRFDGAQWSLVQTPTVVQLNAVWASSASDAIVVGAAGNIFHVDGDDIERAPYITSQNLRGVWGVGDGAIAVGDNGTVLQYDGIEWSLVSHVTSRRLRAVGSSGGDAAFAVGDHGTILRYDGSGWSIEDTPTIMNLFGVWVESEDNAYAVGSHGTILHYDGDGWSIEDTPTTLNLTAVWGFSDTHVYAVGTTGTILEFTGDGWRRVDNVTTLNLSAIHNGFIVGDFGTVLRNPGTLQEVKNLRITEVDPKNGRVEVTNNGPAFTSGMHPFSHRMDSNSAIDSGTPFEDSGIEVFDVRNMQRSDSDLWLYRAEPLDDSNNIIHGVKYGPQANVGETDIAVEAGIWTNSEAHAPAPPGGMSLAYDGFGSDPKDWYVDETPTFGEPDYTPEGVVPRELEYPAGMQDFEAVSLGDEIFAIEDWVIVDERGVPGVFTARAVADVNGDPAMSATARWLRIRDQESGDLDNLVTLPVIHDPNPTAYRWNFSVNLEERSEAGGDSPRIMVQHKAGADFASTWGIEFGDDRVCLVVTGAGGIGSKACLGRVEELAGKWGDFELIVSLVDGFVMATLNGDASASLDIAPVSGAEPGIYRLAYVGSGASNTGTVLMDDVALLAESVPIPSSVSAKTSLDENDVVLTWNVHGRDDVESFDIYRRVDGGPELHFAGPLPASQRRIEDTSLASDHTYAYIVSATKADGTVMRSASATVRIDPQPAVVFSEMRSITTERSVLLLWNPDVRERIDGYRIYRRASNEGQDVELTGGFLLPVNASYFMDETETVGRTYYYSIASVKPNGEETRVRFAPVSVATPRVEITNIYPNPFTVDTQISLNLATNSVIDVTVYDVQGKRVASIPSQAGKPGRNVVAWNGRDDNGRLVATGTYFVRVKAADEVMTRKLVIVR